MVGKDRCDRRRADRGPRRGAAARLPGAGRGARGRRRARLPGRRRVRDLLLGRGRADIDLVVEGDAAALAARLGAEVVAHERFATAKVAARRPRDRHRQRPRGDLPAPGRPARGRAGGRRSTTDLGRRDFTINAMAIPLAGRAAADRPPRRPRRSRGRAAAGPAPGAPSPTTRPGRCAPPATRPASASSWSRRRRRCCARPTSAPSRRTRREAELLRLAAEPRRWRRFELLAEWGLIEPRAGRHRAGRARRRAARIAALERGRAARTAPCSPRRSARPAARSSWRRRARATLGGGRAGAADRARSSWSLPAPWAPSGSTTTSRGGARSSWRSTAPT